MTTLLDDSLFESSYNGDEKTKLDLTLKKDFELLEMFNEDISILQRKEIIKELYNRDKNLIIECVNSVINSYNIQKNSFKKGKKCILWQ